jgi:mono/diheme cytochrome c family protein
MKGLESSAEFRERHRGPCRSFGTHRNHRANAQGHARRGYGEGAEWAAIEQAGERGDASKPGALLYLDNCAACHRPDGKGYDRVFPRLAGNPVVEAPNPVSLISIVLAGSQTPRTTQTPAQFTMPPFAWRLSDRDVADLVNFIRSSWGNSASVASASDVAGVRKAVAQHTD